MSINSVPGENTKCFTIFNIVLFVIVAIGVILLYSLDVPVFERGFFCNDNSIRYPYKDSTVPTSLLLVIVSELLQYWRVYDRVRFMNTDFQTDNGDRQTVRALVQSIVIQSMLLLFGYALTVGVTEVFKVTMGQLRPHFLDVCQLSPGSYNCSQGLGYVTEFTCTQTDKDLLRDARKSFMSGHSSTAFFYMTFIAVYRGERDPRQLMISKAVIQVACLTLACFVGVSRITDYKHHPSDVIGGSILGFIIGYFTARRTLEYVKGQDTCTNSDAELKQVKPV